MARAWHRQGEVGEVGGIQTESGLGATDEEFNFVLTVLISHEGFSVKMGCMFHKVPLGNHLEEEELGNEPG